MQAVLVIDESVVWHEPNAHIGCWLRDIDCAVDMEYFVLADGNARCSQTVVVAIYLNSGVKFITCP